MHFEPAPPNDFAEFSAAYFDRCQAKIPQIVASAAKWRFEDLIPGLSDFDTRFIYTDPMDARDWSEASLAIGRIHTEMAREFPHWARNLEHLPGVNLTVSEMLKPELFYPEFQQWSFYYGDQSTIHAIQEKVSAHTWSNADEAFQLKKAATFFGRYNRTIDPPVNLGPFESKYPLHSRYMHYFTPCVQALISLKHRRNVHGKLEALRLAAEVFPNRSVIEHLFEVLDQHYELPDLYVEPGVSRLEDALESYLSDAWATMAGALQQIEVDANDDRAALAGKVAMIAADPVETFFSGTRFARQMKGRLLFFAQEIPWFDSTWLIQIELGRIVKMLFTTPLRVVGLLRYGSSAGDSPEATLARMEGNLLEPRVCQGMRHFVAVASQPLVPGQEKAAAHRVAECCDPVLEAVTVMSEYVAQYAATRG